MLFSRDIWFGLSFSLLTKVWGSGASFLISVVIANRLPVEEAGLFFLAMTIVFVASVISLQGFENLLVKSVSNYLKEENYAGINRVACWAVWRIMLVSTVLSVLFFLSADFIAAAVFSKAEFAPVMKVFCWAFITASLTNVLVSMFKGAGSAVVSVFIMTAAVPTLMLLLILIGDTLALPGFSFRSVESLGFLYLSSTIVILISAALLWMTSKYRKSNDSLGTASVVEEYGDALLPFFYTSVLFVFIQYFTQIFVGAVLSSADVALLSVALRVAMLISFVLVAVNAVSSPKFAVYFKQNQLEALKRYSNKISKLLFLFGLVMVVFVMVFAEQVLWLFGDAYTDAALLLRIIAFGQFINVSTGSVGAILQMSGNEKYFLRSVLVSCGIAVLGSVVLVPLYGVVAAALVIASAVATQNLLAFFIVRQRLGFYSLSFS